MELSRFYVSVPSFYAEKSVFITGGSGFLGKVLIEKLLYSCPLLDKIYVLLREKRNVSSELRFKNILEQPLFSRIKAKNPSDLEKIILIKGELTAPNCGMSPEDLQTIIKNVSIVIHSAATVKFNEPLNVAMSINVEGTRNVLQLCKKLKRVDSFVHVSTAYSNCNHKVIEELVYPAPSTIEDANIVAEKGSEDDVTAILNGFPNTYTFTKALAENLIKDDHEDIPTVIVRPSIVTGAKSEPVEGWVDNWFGPAAFMSAAARGICRVLYSDYNNNIDIIPVEYVCNTILVAATRAERSQKVAVYNSCSGSSNPISIGDAFKHYADAGYEDRFSLLPFRNHILHTQRIWLIRLNIFVMYIIMYIADFILKLSRKKTKFVKMFSKLVTMQKAIQFFTGRSWLMKSSGTLALARSLSPEDYQQFPCNPEDIQWKEYITIYYKGVKKYLIEPVRPRI